MRYALALLPLLLFAADSTAVGSGIRLGSSTSMPSTGSIGGSGSAAQLLFELGDPAAPTFGLIPEAPIDGLELVARYVGDDMPSSSTGTWSGTGTGAVTLTGTGAATPTLDGRRIVPATTYGVTEGNIWRAANTTDTDVSIGVRDFIVLALVRHKVGDTNSNVVSTQHSGDPGYELRVAGASTTCAIRSPTLGTLTDIRTAAIDVGAWSVRGCIFDRDGYMEAWGTRNGSGSPTNISAGAAETLDSSTYRFTVGASPNSDQIFTGAIAWVDIWACPTSTPDCLTVSAGGQDYDTELVAARDKVFGVVGYDDGAEVTTSISTRNSSAYGRICDTTSNTMVYELFADHLMRTELACGQTWDSFTSDTLYRGFMHEGGTTNAFSAAEDATNVAWTKTNATAVADSSCGGTLYATDSTCTEIRAADTASNQKSISQAGANIDEIDHAYFALKAGAVDYAQTNAGGNNWVTWDLTTCTAAEQGSGVDQIVRLSFRNGWCYVGFSGDAAMASVSVIPCNTAVAASGCTYTAADTTSAQIEFRYGGATTGTGGEHGYQSPIHSAGRTEDIMEFPVTIPAGPHTFIYDVQAPRNDSYVELSVLSDNDATVHSISKSGDFVRNYGDLATVRLFNIVTSDVIHTDQARHIIRSTWAADDVKAYVDGILGGTDTDTSGNAPPAFSFLFWGKTNDADDNSHGTTWDVRVYSGIHPPGSGGTGTDVP